MCAWNAKATGGYNRTSTEALENVQMIGKVLGSIGWRKPAIAAMLGNGAGESGLNPWRWESDYVPTYSEFAGWNYEQGQQHGYGIFGYTPASSYINATNASKYARYGYAPNFRDIPGNATDGEAQMRYFADTVKPNWTHSNYGYFYPPFIAIGIDITPFYYFTYEEFIKGRDSNDNEISLDYLAGAFELCYEKPNNYQAANSYSYRVDNTYYWYDVIKDMNFPSGGGSDFDIMFYLKPKYKRM